MQQAEERGNTLDRSACPASCYTTRRVKEAERTPTPRGNACVSWNVEESWEEKKKKKTQPDSNTAGCFWEAGVSACLTENLKINVKKTTTKQKKKICRCEMQMGDWNTPAHRQGCTVWGCKWEDKRPRGTSWCFRVCLAFSCWNFLKRHSNLFPIWEPRIYPFVLQNTAEVRREKKQKNRWLKSKIRLTHAGKMICNHLAPKKFCLLSKCWINN